MRCLSASLPGRMSLLVVGSIAFDAIKSPFGGRERRLGTLRRGRTERSASLAHLGNTWVYLGKRGGLLKSIAPRALRDGSGRWGCRREAIRVHLRLQLAIAAHCVVQTAFRFRERRRIEDDQVVVRLRFFSRGSYRSGRSPTRWVAMASSRSCAVSASETCSSGSRTRTVERPEQTRKVAAAASHAAPFAYIAHDDGVAVIDVGINRLPNGQLLGDVEFETKFANYSEVNGLQVPQRPGFASGQSGPSGSRSSSVSHRGWCRGDDRPR